LLETDYTLTLPVHRTIQIIVTSNDVLHSWAVPSLGIKLDACPGRMNIVNVLILRESQYYGQCSEICGVNHGFMPIVIKSKYF
jgi:heme/copper-type cytochrome/quinol oxidase subunit 2